MINFHNWVNNTILFYTSSINSSTTYSEHKPKGRLVRVSIKLKVWIHEPNGYYEDSLKLWSCKFFLSCTRDIFFCRPDLLRVVGFHGPHPSEIGFLRSSTSRYYGIAQLHHLLDPHLGRFELCPFATTWCLVVYVSYLNVLFFYLDSFNIAYLCIQNHGFIYIWCSHFSLFFMCSLIFIIQLLCHFCNKKRDIIEYLIHLKGGYIYIYRGRLGELRHKETP